MTNKMTVERIGRFLFENDVPLVGFAKPQMDRAIEELIVKHKQKSQYIYFGDIAIEQRQNFEAVFPVCKEIIVIGIPYTSVNKHMQFEGVALDGFISNMAWEYDYHVIVKEKLTLLKEFLLSADKTIQTMIQVDTGPLIDRHIAYQAGLGSYGKNQNLMNERFGTEFYIGYLMVDRSFSEGKDVSKTNLPLRALVCSGCDVCVKACPAGVLSDDFEFDGQRCISYLTQKKDHLSWFERGLIGNSVYGCDICQKSCPKNCTKELIPMAYERQTLNRVSLENLLNTSNKQLMRQYRQTGFAWRGAKVLKRNALIAIGNSKSHKYLSFLETLLAETSDYLRPYVLWALYQCGDRDIINRCQACQKKYSDLTTKEECQMILQIVK